jgi:hypothetical protein
MPMLSLDEKKEETPSLLREAEDEILNDPGGKIL